MKSVFICFIFALFSETALGRPLEINVRDYGWLTSFPALKDALDFYVQGVENDLNSDQPILNPKRLNFGTANSSVLASKGLGTDYVNNPEKFQISLGLGAAWDAEKNKAIKDEISGAAAASSVTLGMRMDQFEKATLLGLETKKMMGFINFGRAGQSTIIPGKDIDIAGNVEATNFGMHLRYDLIEKSPNELLGWGGVKLHLGYEYNKNRVDLTTELDEPLELDTGGQGILSGRLTGQPKYRIETTTHSIPFELSTSISILKVFDLYSGLGADMNFGRSKGKGIINGDFTALACTSGICVGETVVPQVEAQANYNSESQVKNMTFRAFGGAQVDLPLGLHAFGQMEQIIGTEVKGVSGGLKYTF